ncbi:zinc finger (Ran-binding) family protein [Euphorbia peplus]|nr:zinc finger (Ran-binding) family protein [Euphorbia peplus]
MAQTAISNLIKKRIIQTLTLNPKSSIFLSRNLTLKPYSTSPDPPPSTPSSLSARMSFIFDQIDSIERERAQKDETLQRIRAWRQSKNTTNQNPETIVTDDNPGASSSKRARFEPVSPLDFSLDVKEKKEVELVHPWPEWIDLMQRLVHQNYFDHRRIDEDKLVEDSGFDGGGMVNSDEVGIDFKDYRTVQTACVNFGKDRFDIFRKLSRQDIQILVGYGCPSADKKVVFSSKLLRKHVHLDEGEVCSNCSLRSSCERAYLVTNKEDEARTIDLMRVLLAYGFDPINGFITNKSLLKQKSLKTIVRKLLHEVVKLSAVPIDPNLPPPVIKRPPPKVKQPPPTPKRRVGRDDVEMKKGDWVCPKCDFMNFAKNTVCLQCDAKRPKRQLLPGEWECPECNFLNYRRNMACFHCDCKRPPDEFIEDKMEERRPIHKTRAEKIPDRSEVSNAWNFDFDDNESDGADVAAFEYADHVRMDEDPLGVQADGGNFRGPDDFNGAGRSPMVHDREYSEPSHSRHRTGFDDFDDEDDDIDSYEVDTDNHAGKGSQNNFSQQGTSDWDNVENYDDVRAKGRKSHASYSKPSRSMHKTGTFSGSDDDEHGIDSDDDLARHPKWKSSHVADARHKSRGRDQRGRSRGLTFGSDDDIDLDSDADDDFGSSRRKVNKQGSGRRNYQSSDLDDVSESEDDEVSSRGNRYGRKKMEVSGRRDNYRGGGDYDFERNATGRSKGKMGDRKNSWNDDFDTPSSSRRSHDTDRRFQGNDRFGQRMNDRGSKPGGFSSNRRFDGNDHSGRRTNDRGGKSGSFNNNRRFDGNDRAERRTNGRGDKSGSFRGAKRGFEDRRQERSHDYKTEDLGECRNRRRVIERIC